MITDYLVELLDELQVPTRRRRRILAEVEDHLSCSAADLHASGLDALEAEHEAIRRFGPAAELARALLEQEAALAGKRAARASGLLAALLAFLLGPAHRLFPGGESVFPTSLVCFVAVQVALVAGVLTLARAWRPDPSGGPTGARLALVLRGAAVVVCCAGAAVVLGSAHDIESSGQAPGAWLGLTGLAVAVAGTGATLVRSRRLALGAARIGDVAGDRVEAPPDALGDLHAVALTALTRLGRRAPSARRVLGACERLIQTLPTRLAARAPRLFTSVDPGRRPWRFAVSISTAAGLAMAAGHAAAEGVSARHPLGALYAGALIATVEALAALLGFAVLGRFLGLRSRRPPAG